MELKTSEWIKDFLNTFVQVFWETLGENLVGIYVHGSLAMESFNPVSSDVEAKRMVNVWAVSVVAYLFGAFTVNLVTVPNLGMTSTFESSMMQSGGSGWSSGGAHTTLAFGLIYFSILALAKYAMSGSAKGAARPVGRAQSARGAGHGRGQS